MNDLKAFKNHLSAIGYSKLTIKQYLSYASKLKEVSQEGVNELINAHNHKVCKAALINYVKKFLRKYEISIIIKRKPVGRVKPKGLSVEEYHLFLNHLENERDRLVTEVLTEGGFRVGEVVRNDDDEEKGVRPKSLDGLWITLKLKREKWDRAKLSVNLVTRLEKYIKVMGFKDDELIFNICTRYYRRLCQLASEKAGMRHVHPHLLKHTTSRRCDEAGLIPSEKKVILHHAKVDTTIDHYDNPELKGVWGKLRGREVP